MVLQVTNPDAELLTIPTTVNDVQRQAILNQLLAQRSPLSEGSWLQAVRDRAAALLQDQSLPSNRDEDWRFTNLTEFYSHTFGAAAPASLGIGDIEPWAIAPDAIRVVLVNGFLDHQLSTLDNLPTGLFIGSLTEETTDGKMHLGQQPGHHEVFTALNTASVADGVLMSIAPATTLTQPIHLLYLTVPGATPWAVMPRTLIKAGLNSTATLVETYGHVGEGLYWVNAVTEITVAHNAQLNHTRVQQESATAFHTGKTAVTQYRDSRYTLNSLSIGAQMARHNPEVTLKDSQTETRLNGLTLANQKQIGDTHSLIHFTQPHCVAHQLHKCIVDDRARTVFNGRIYVPKEAQQTNAAQLSRNLLLSNKARVDTKPQLEIIADDVKCAHGATVSQLDDDEIFYLQSRGLDRQSACDLLVKGFVAEIIEKVPVLELRSRLLQAVLSPLRR